jgi:colanic acid biosynthesis glycosyl transferase WcaI
MRITLINQAFYPDVVATGQYLKDFALGLAENGHEVTVITSRRAYDDPNKTFPGHEIWRGIRIYRVSGTSFGKRAKWRRAADFFTFLVSCCCRLCLLSKPDVIVALTSPPLVSVIAAGYARLRGVKFCYWIMDLNPDEAVAAGWLSPGSFAARWTRTPFPFQFEPGFRHRGPGRFHAAADFGKRNCPRKNRRDPSLVARFRSPV